MTEKIVDVNVMLQQHLYENTTSQGGLKSQVWVHEG